MINIVVLIPLPTVLDSVIVTETEAVSEIDLFPMLPLGIVLLGELITSTFSSPAEITV
jgi:hypothetical protein